MTAASRASEAHRGPEDTGDSKGNRAGGTAVGRPSAIETRARLLGAARSAFGTKGHDGTNLVKDILEPAGVSVGSFYHQFADKTALLAALVEESTDIAANAVQGVQAQQRDAHADPVRIARASFDALLDLVDEHEDLVRIQFRERHHPDPRVREPLRQAREQWIEAMAVSYRALFPDGFPASPDLAAEMVAALGVGAMLQYLDAPPAERPALRRHLVATLAAFTIGGFLGLAQFRPPDRR
jgi:AcrR family transcriptional regulator